MGTGPEVHEGFEITSEEAETLLQSDLIVFDAGVAKTCAVATSCQHSALVSLAYNIGLANFAKSSVARLHNAERYAEAAQAFALWNKAGGVVLPGLVSRRAAEAAMYLLDQPVENAPTAAGEKPLIQSRAINGQAIAGTGLAASAGLASLRDSMSSWSDWQNIVMQIIPYFNDAKWVFVALVACGIGMTMYARWHDRNAGRA